jgi:NAD(P)-dependent dehydrogenase (short-subunit alcohol dehydrogenase family)
MSRRSNPLSQFQDRVVVITGAASGIGQEMAAQLCAAGAQVVAIDIDSNRLKKVEITLAQAGGQIEIYVLDVGDSESLGTCIDATVKKHGRLDYMISNAGIAGRAGEIRDLTQADWDKILRVNLVAVIQGASIAYRHMIKQGNGHIVNMASAAGLLGTPALSAYGTTKAAVVEFSRDLRVEAEAWGVRVTVLCPGFVESRVFDNADLRGLDPEAIKALIPVQFVPTEKAVRMMLMAVLKNRAIVTLPSYVKFLWFLRRLMPVFLDRMVGRRVMTQARAERRPSSLL